MDIIDTSLIDTSLIDTSLIYTDLAKVGGFLNKKGRNLVLNSKQRANLMSLANGIKPLFQVGKEGVTPAQLEGIAQALAKRELIKITVLKNSGLSSRALISQLAASLRAEPVAAIGFKMVIYKRSDDKTIKHIEF